jgi:steroid 5-alpha reductase family enzyme
MITSWLISIIIAQTLMVFAWLAYRYVGNPIVADIAWGINITLLALVHQKINGAVHWTFVWVALWGIRLSFYLYWTRLRHHWHDKRYQALQERSEHLFLNYQIQGLLQTFIALPWLFIQDPIPVYIQLIASLTFITGFFFECMADYQLHHFKATRSGLCREGLWQYSRHPNYFGEILIWFSFSGLGLWHSWGYIGLGSPLALYGIMRYITGPLTEATSISSKGKIYIDYQKTTPMIFPKLRFHFWLNRS